MFIAFILGGSDGVIIWVSGGLRRIQLWAFLFDYFPKSVFYG